MSSSDLTTEEKIKAAAESIFLEKGYEATKTRDIAEAANINLALVNYYFRSKKGLFDIIMMDNLQRFFGIILNVLNDPNTSINAKIEAFVDHYIDLLKKDPNIPLFIFSEVRNNPAEFMAKMGMKEKIQQTYFIRQFQEEVIGKNTLEINPLHIFMNLSSMIVFPFIASPIMTEVFSINTVSFNQLMEERKKLIPQWIKIILTNSTQKNTETL
ncbi:MAG: TetR/AcrR family transcriptional regulator [Bacteroidetes bacterium]|nr:TetR/AcrR family transcriptional regulator [Bacteroidota bacterium]